MVQVATEPIINEYVDIWKANNEYIPVVIKSHGNDADIWIIELIEKFTYKYQGIEKGARLLTSFWRRVYVTKSNDAKLSLRSGAIILIQYFYSEAQSELYCGVVANGERGKVRDIELKNIRIVECPDVREVSDAISELESKNYYYDKWIYPYTPWIIALAKRLYGIQL